MARSAKSATSIYVALLRAINVGGNNMVSMKALKESFERLRFSGVTTYINSGNVVFRTSESDQRKLEDTIDRMLEKDYGLKPKTVVRSQDDMQRLVDRIAKTWGKPDPDWRYNVIFLRHDIDSKNVLDGIAWKPGIERVVYCPGTLLWSAHASDVPRTAMLKLSSKPVFQNMTVRNINTTTKLLELMRRAESDS